MQPADILTKLLNSFNNKLSAVIPDKIIISCYNEDIHRVGMVGIFKLKSMNQGLQCSTGNGDVICMQGISLVRSAGGGGGSKKIVERRVRQNNFGSFSRVW